MTRTTNARVAGFTFWVYFAAGMTGLRLAGNAPATAVLSIITSLVMLLPLQIAGFFGGPRNWSSPVTWAVWFPLLVFELTLAVWLIVRGAAMPAQRQWA